MNVLVFVDLNLTFVEEFLGLQRFISTKKKFGSFWGTTYSLIRTTYQ